MIEDFFYLVRRDSGLQKLLAGAGVFDLTGGAERVVIIVRFGFVRLVAGVPSGRIATVGRLFASLRAVDTFFVGRFVFGFFFIDG